MKVAILSPTIDVANGWGNFTREYCWHLAGQLDFTLFLPKDYQLGKEEKLPFPVKCILPEFVPEFRRKNNPEPFLKPRIKVSEFDLIHSLVAFPYGILTHRIAEAISKPFIITTHGSYAVIPLLSYPDRELLQEAYLKSDLIISPSNFTAKRIRKYTRGSINLEVMPHAVNYQKFQSPCDISSLRKEYGDNRILLNIGQLKPRKGQDILIRAVRIVIDSIPNIRCLLIGKDGWDGFLHSLVFYLGLEKRIIFLGEKREEELIKYIKLCDVFVHTPCMIKNKFEGFGIVYLEAGACGKPVIGSKSGGVPDAVKDRITGILVPEGNVRATAKAIIRVLGDEKLAHQLGEEGRKNAEKLRWENYVSTMKKIYESVLK